MLRDWVRDHHTDSGPPLPLPIAHLLLLWLCANANRARTWQVMRPLVTGHTEEVLLEIPQQPEGTFRAWLNKVPRSFHTHGRPISRAYT